MNNLIETDNMIFVFGSNEGGKHGAGAASFAYRKRGAIMGRAIGQQGQSWAIPTKDQTIRFTLPLDVIQRYVDVFIHEAHIAPHQQYQITQIGCGLAGLNPWQIAPMFRGATPNCFFDTAWQPYLGEQYAYWGTF